MKLKTNTLLLSAVAAYPALLIAKLAGVPLSSKLLDATAVGLFAAVLTVALCLVEYSRKSRALPLRVPPARRKSQRRVLLPTQAAFSSEVRLRVKREAAALAAA